MAFIVIRLTSERFQGRHGKFMTAMISFSDGREMNSAKWTWFAIGYQCGLAYAVALAINQIGSAFTGNPNIVGLLAAMVIIAGMIYMLFRPYREATKLTRDVKLKTAAKSGF